MSLILPALAATLVFTLYWFFVNMTSKKDTVSERVRRLAPDLSGTTAADDSGLISADAERSGIAGACAQILAFTGVDVEKYERDNQMRFYQAGMQSPDSAIYYLFYKRVLRWLVLGLAALLFMKDSSGTDKLLFVLCGAILLVIGLVGADLYLTNSKQKRQKVLVRSFPDALDLLLVCVESGLALDGALSRVCKELGRAHPEITVEFNKTRLELTLLNDRGQALNNLGERTDLVPFRSLVATLMQSEKFGTSLTDTLRVLSEDYRIQRLMIAENKAGRLPALMTIPLICFMLPAFFMIVMGPAFINLFRTIAEN